MVDGHNWNQIHQFLLHAGFREIIDQTDGIISYQDTKGRRLVINKSNNMSCDYLQRILAQLKVTYDEFVAEYKAAYGASKA